MFLPICSCECPPRPTATPPCGPTAPKPECLTPPVRPSSLEKCTLYSGSGSSSPAGQDFIWAVGDACSLQVYFQKWIAAGTAQGESILLSLNILEFVLLFQRLLKDQYWRWNLKLQMQASEHGLYNNLTSIFTLVIPISALGLFSCLTLVPVHFLATRYKPV